MTPQVPLTSSILRPTITARAWSFNGPSGNVVDDTTMLPITRYDLRSLSATGRHATVWKAVDTLTGEVVAIKVLHTSLDDMTRVRYEVSIIADLKSVFSEENILFGHILGCVYHLDRPSLVFEYYPMSLYGLVHDKKISSLPLRHTQEIMYQILQGISYLHYRGIIHTDLKTSNVMLRHADIIQVREMTPDYHFVERALLRSVEIRLVGFGDAVRRTSTQTERIGSDGYRSPEICLNLPWDYPTDIFSVGCIFFEILSGNALFFRAKTDAERLAAMEAAIGLFPLCVVEEANKIRYGAFYSDAVWRVRFPRYSHHPEYSSSELERAFDRLARTRNYRTSVLCGAACSLLRGLLSLSAPARITAYTATQHGFFRMGYGR